MSTAGIALLVYVFVLYALSLWAQHRIRDAEDYVVAGRSLSLPLASATLFATWFGAATMLTAADEVRRRGLERIALEPLGSGLCLILAGIFFARRLWHMRLLTLADFFRRRFGPVAEVVSAGIMVPSFFGWIAVQFISLAAMLELLFGLPPEVGIALVAVVGGGYTWLGGMWSVTLTDAVQALLVLVGLVILALSVLGVLGGDDPWLGLTRLVEETPPDLLRAIPTETAVRLLDWIGILSIAALGNIAGQDLMQRIFASKSAAVAQRACWLAGGAYLTFGMIPVMLGLASRFLLAPDLEEAIVPALAQAFLSPLMGTVFTLALASAILSTLDSAILAPASVLAINILERFNRGRLRLLTLTRLGVLLVTASSLAVAYVGESAYGLLQGAYSLTLVGLFVPLAFGLFGTPRGQRPAVVSMAAGCGLWSIHALFGWEHFLEPWLAAVRLPVELTVTVVCFAVYPLCHAAGRPE